MLSHNRLINTGNILSLNEVKKKAGQNPSDELVESLKITLKESESRDDASTNINGRDDVSVKNHDRTELKIAAKIFISSPISDSLKEAVDQVFNVLQTDSIESLVIAYGRTDNPEEILSSLQSLWTLVEEYVKLGKLSSVGVSDVDTDVFIKLFQWANVRYSDIWQTQLFELVRPLRCLACGCIVHGSKNIRELASSTIPKYIKAVEKYCTVVAMPVKPNIVQINLATCCVVPPALQVFTKENDVQLLTHSDPCQILPRDRLHEVCGDGVNLHWVARYQVHVKCRGVLSTKGYLVYVTKHAVPNK